MLHLFFVDGWPVWRVYPLWYVKDVHAYNNYKIACEKTFYCVKFSLFYLPTKKMTCSKNNWTIYFFYQHWTFQADVWLAAAVACEGKDVNGSKGP